MAMNATQEKLEARIETIKQALQKIGPMRPGSLSRQYTVCGKPTCRCADPDNPRKHGPYYQLSYSHKGKSTTQFIQEKFLPEVRQQLATYKRFRELTDDWVRLSLELSKEKLKQAKMNANT